MKIFLFTLKNEIETHWQQQTKKSMQTIELKKEYKRKMKNITQLYDVYNC